MRRCKSRDTKPELTLRKKLWALGYRYRKNFAKLFGKPDIALIGRRVAIFVDGRMWHGYDWERRKNDFKTHREYWIPKIERNIARDKEVTEKLRDAGWTVLRFWDFEIESDLEGCIERIKQACDSSPAPSERRRGAADRDA